MAPDQANSAVIGPTPCSMPWVSTMALDKLHAGSLQSWADHRRNDGAPTGTIDHGLEVGRRGVEL